MQLAQTGFSLMDKTPGAIAEAINGAANPARLTQLNRYVTLDTPLGPDVLLVSAAVVDEHVNRLPEIHLDLLSHRHDLRPEDLIGQQVKIRFDQQARLSTLERVVASGAADNDRYFDGYVASFDRAGNPGNVTQYHLTAVPWFWFLTRSTAGSSRTRPRRTSSPRSSRSTASPTSYSISGRARSRSSTS